MLETAIRRGGEGDGRRHIWVVWNGQQPAANEKWHSHCDTGVSKQNGGLALNNTCTDTNM